MTTEYENVRSHIDAVRYKEEAEVSAEMQNLAYKEETLYGVFLAEMQLQSMYDDADYALMIDKIRFENEARFYAHYEGRS